MNRDTAITVAIAVLAVIALALGAATLDPLDTDAGGPVGPGHDNGFQLGGPPPINSSGGSGGALPPLVGRLLFAAIVVFTLIGLYSVYRRYGPRQIARLLAVVVVIGLVAYALIRLFANGGAPTGRNGTLGSGPVKIPGGGGGSSSDSGTSFPVPPLVLLAGFAVVLIGGAVVAFRSSAAASPDSDPEPDAEEGTEVAALGRAAGRAADRIDDDADTRNEVYRAWQEMTDHLDVANPESSTPEEFADAATDAGMGRRDVTELTDLFRDTRYGGHEVTDERSSRAVAALRRIEAAYAPEEQSDLTTGRERGRGRRTEQEGRSDRDERGGRGGQEERGGRGGQEERGGRGGRVERDDDGRVERGDDGGSNA